MTELRSGQRWRHKKTGGIYEIVETRCAIQCSAAPELEAMFEDDIWVGYRNIKGGSLVFRPEPEFLDGHFGYISEGHLDY